MQHYSDTEYIGGGGFAWVFRATRKDGSRVAVKIPINPDMKTGKLFIREVANWSNLEHENIVNLYDFNIFPTPYFEMELCDGSLEQKPRSVEEAVTIIYEVAKGLRYAHERYVIHGDIKPPNVLTKNGRVKISDWDLSKVKTVESVSLSGITPQYSAPEQISDEFGKADERTDIYQLGATFYELVTGEPPFKGELSKVYRSILHDDPKFPSGINPDIARIIMKCLKKKKDERYQSVDVLLKELEDYKPERGETTVINEKEEVRETVELPQVRFCTECGSELEEDAVFCTKCGYKVR